MSSTTELGPVDYAVVAFPGNQFNGQIAPAILDLVDDGTIRIIDLVFLLKDPDGSVHTLELTDLAPDVRAVFEREGVAVEGLFDDSDLTAAGEELAPNSSALLVVWENLWAVRVTDAVRASGGELLDFARLPREVVQAVRDAVLSSAGEER